MNLLDKLHRTRQIFINNHFPVARTTLEQRLSCSKSTVGRIIEKLKYYGAVIDYDKQTNSYVYDRIVVYELPGIWFTQDEIFGLITAHDLLTNAEPGLINDTLQPLRAKLDKLLATDKLGAGQLPKRVRIIRQAGRGPGACFTEVSRALIERKQLQFDYHARTTDEDKSRKVSPQRLTHYRDNWYLDAWCHDSKQLKSYALERIRNARVSRLDARDIDDNKLNEHYASSWGIYAGQPIGTARLIFSPQRAQWISEEQWHPNQVGVFLADGRYQLDIPYSHERELAMEILKNGADVEVVSPDSLRVAVQKMLQEALAKYTNAPKAAPDKGFGDVVD
jgi:proteasome accessory factor C